MAWVSAAWIWVSWPWISSTTRTGCHTRHRYRLHGHQFHGHLVHGIGCMSIEDAGHFMINHKIEKRRIRKILIFLHILTRRKGRSKNRFTFYFFTEKRLHEQKFGFQRELGGRKAIKAYYFILSINYIYIIMCGFLFCAKCYISTLCTFR